MLKKTNDQRGSYLDAKQDSLAFILYLKGNYWEWCAMIRLYYKNEGPMKQICAEKTQREINQATTPETHRKEEIESSAQSEQKAWEMSGNIW